MPFLYVVGNGTPGTPVKIGITNDLTKRIDGLQTGHPYKLRPILSIELPKDIVRLAETMCHELLEADRLHGEWFSTSPEEAVALVTKVVELRLWGGSELRCDATIAVRLAPEMKALAEEAAKADDRTLSKWVERLIREAVERQKKPN